MLILQFAFLMVWGEQVPFILPRQGPLFSVKLLQQNTTCTFLDSKFIQRHADMTGNDIIFHRYTNASMGQQGDIVEVISKKLDLIYKFVEIELNCIL